MVGATWRSLSMIAFICGLLPTTPSKPNRSLELAVQLEVLAGQPRDWLALSTTARSSSMSSGLVR